MNTGVVVAGLALIGTFLQMIQSLGDVARLVPRVRDVFALEDLRTEHRLYRHPIKWARTQWQFLGLLWPKDGADEEILDLRSAWLAVWGHILGWLSLLLAALFGFLAALGWL